MNEEYCEKCGRPNRLITDEENHGYRLNKWLKSLKPGELEAVLDKAKTHE